MYDFNPFKFAPEDFETDFKEQEKIAKIKNQDVLDHIFGTDIGTEEGWDALHALKLPTNHK